MNALLLLRGAAGLAAPFALWAAGRGRPRRDADRGGSGEGASPGGEPPAGDTAAPIPLGEDDYAGLARFAAEAVVLPREEAPSPPRAEWRARVERWLRAPGRPAPITIRTPGAVWISAPRAGQPPREIRLVLAPGPRPLPAPGRRYRLWLADDPLGRPAHFLLLAAAEIPDAPPPAS